MLVLVRIWSCSWPQVQLGRSITDTAVILEVSGNTGIRRFSVGRIVHDVFGDVFETLHGSAAQYLVDDCQLVTTSGRRQLRSSDVNTCVIQRIRLGDRSFAVAGPRLWNSLPAGLRHINLSIGQFRSALKTHLFNWVGRL